MRRREFIRIFESMAAGITIAPALVRGSEKKRKPNVIFILADDLGYGELGCFGQEKISTTSLDRMAAEGMRFTEHYSGSPVCAPSRCTLLTGLHTGHAYIRDNDELGERGDVWHDLSLEGQRPLPEGTETLGRLFQRAGYRTAAIGKWGLGGPGSPGEPNNQGFDHFFGYLCQRIAHNYYPSYLWRNHEKVHLKGNRYFFPHQKLPPERDPQKEESYAEYGGSQYSSDLMTEEALAFIRENKEKPFFLYLAYTVPHVALQVPGDSLKEYEGKFPETPYKGEKGYLPHRRPRAAYAAMISRMDRDIGSLLALLDELGIDEETMVIFTSDNGPTFNGGTDSEFFSSAGPFRGLKTMLYEGGIRIPLIVRWPGRVPAGRVSRHVSAFWDFYATFADLLGVGLRVSDGISMLPSFLGDAERQRRHSYLYWEFQGGQAVRCGPWKALRPKRGKPMELYNLDEDIGESRNLASRRIAVMERMERIMREAHVHSELFPLEPDK